MKKYKVKVPFLCSFSISVEADNEDEAVDKAFEDACPRICQQCGKDITIGDPDWATYPEVTEE
jgi:hypothetical protein